MNRYYLFLLITLFVSADVCTQPISPGKYISQGKYIYPKYLRLCRDSSFFFSDWSSGCCSTSFTASGKWQVNKDTLYLDEIYHSQNYVVRRKYLVRSNIIFYADTADKNMVVNWGPLIREEIAKQPIKRKLLFRPPGRGIGDIHPHYGKKINDDSIRSYRFYFFRGNQCSNYRDILITQSVRLRWSESHGSPVIQVYNFYKRCTPGFRVRGPYYVLLREYPLSHLPDTAIVKNFKPPEEWMYIRLKRPAPQFIQLNSYVGTVIEVVDPYSMFELYYCGMKLN